MIISVIFVIQIVKLVLVLCRMTVILGTFLSYYFSCLIYFYLVIYLIIFLIIFVVMKHAKNVQEANHLNAQNAQEH